MKKIVTISAIILSMMLCLSCQRQNNDEVQRAALKLYEKYADNERLTVAYLGDLMLQDKAIDAVMIQASNDEDWEKLHDEFAVQQHVEAIEDSLGEALYTVDMGVQLNTSVDTDAALLQKEHLDDEEIGYFAQAIVE